MPPPHSMIVYGGSWKEEESYVDFPLSQCINLIVPVAVLLNESHFPIQKNRQLSAPILSFDDPLYIGI